MTARWVLLFVITAGCASGRGDGASGDGQRDASVGSPGGRIDAPAGGQIDAPAGGQIDAPGGGGGGSGLDPELSLPDPGGQVCSQPGRIGSPACPAAEVCRYFTSTEGRCEACPAGCGGLGASCSATNQCDILFECYQGRCTNFCTLGSIECGAPADCINIGHATRGVCRL